MRIKDVWFGSSSELKLSQYRHHFAEHGIDLHRGITFPSTIEPQAAVDMSSSSDIFEFAVKHPLSLSARFITQKGTLPYMVEDTMLFVSAFSKDIESGFVLPGADTKNW